MTKCDNPLDFQEFIRQLDKFSDRIIKKESIDHLSRDELIVELKRTISELICFNSKCENMEWYIKETDLIFKRQNKSFEDALELLRELVVFADVNQNLIGKVHKDAFEKGKAFLARQGLAKRHAENRAMKQEVFKWLDDNMQNYKSMEAAATAITGGIAPIAWSTARRWVSEWKKLSSTGRG